MPCLIEQTLFLYSMVRTTTFKFKILLYFSFVATRNIANIVETLNASPSPVNSQRTATRLGGLATVHTTDRYRRPRVDFGPMPHKVVWKTSRLPPRAATVCTGLDRWQIARRLPTDCPVPPGIVALGGFDI